MGRFKLLINYIQKKFITSLFFGSFFFQLILAFQPQTAEELQTAVNLWYDNNPSALSTYGEINTWDTSLITDMSQLFSDKTIFNDDISNWDVSNVTNMMWMFNEAESFNQDISSWDVSSVITMNYMLRRKIHLFLV